MKNTSKIFSVWLLQSVSAMCEYNIPQITGENGEWISGFHYNSTWETPFPSPAHHGGAGNVTIQLPENYSPKQWTIQLRWPVELMDLKCWANTAKEQNCGGDPTNSVDGVSCKKQHYHMTAHFWDDFEKDELTREITIQWLFGTEWDFVEGPIPCVDWCDFGVVPEYPGPCTNTPTTTTQTPTTTTSTTEDYTTGVLPEGTTEEPGMDLTPAPTVPTTTTTTLSELEQCEEACLDDYFVCSKGCSPGDSVCQSECSRNHFDCFNSCSVLDTE